MKIRVTEEHIKLGKRGSERSCPLALAIKEATGQIQVSVAQYRCRFYYSTGIVDKRLPHSAVYFYKLFDMTGIAGPFEFELEWDDENPSN